MNGIKNILLYFSVLICVLYSCETDSCLHGTGDQTQIRIETGFFETLKVKGILDVILIQDTICFVELDGGDKVLNYVTAEIVDSALWLNNTNSCFYFRDYAKTKVYVHFTHLNRIDLFEACRLASKGCLDSLYYLTVQGPMAEVDLELNTNRFSFYNNKTTGGLYTFRGNCDNLVISGYYIAKINLEGITARNFSVNNSSLSDFYVSATELLKIQIHNRGNIYYSGNPEIIIDSISGNGMLLPWIE
jgi:hypothetical protein